MHIVPLSSGFRGPIMHTRKSAINSRRHIRLIYEVNQKDDVTSIMLYGTMYFPQKSFSQ